jgi:CheY-like chemotaxis protein
MEIVPLVEDAVRRITAEVLRRKGYRVLEAKNAGEAMLLAEADPPAPIDLLLTDFGHGE